MPKLIPCLRLLDASHFTSGALIAERLQISRASVSTALSQAETYGIALERRHGLGYRLLKPVEWLEVDAIQTALPLNSACKIEVVDRIESTNRSLLAQHQHGRVLAAEWQSGGRGRMGRPWLGALGNSLLFSLAWTFPVGAAQLAGLPLAVGVALARAIQQAGVSAMGLKWPNDLWLPTGKVGGILIEMHGDALGPSHVVIGVGLNLSLSAEMQQIDQEVAALRDAGLQCSRSALLGKLIAELESTLNTFAESGFAPLRAEWDAYHIWKQEAVSVSMPDGSALLGYALGVTANGALRLDIHGQERLIHSGDVSLRRQKP